jgi:hypothetical protein
VTRTEILRLLSAVVPLLALILLATERRMIRRLRNGGAVSAATAIPLNARSVFARFRLARLRSAGAVVTASADRFFLDADAYARYRRWRRKRALAVIAILLLLALVLLWLS